MTSKKTMAIAIWAILLGLASWGIFRSIQNEKSDTGTSIPTYTATTSEEVSTNLPGIEYGFTENAASTPPSNKPSIPMPSFSYTIVIPASFSEANKEEALKTLTGVISKLKENPNNAGLWGELGFYRKSIEDYKGAKEALEYALALNPYNAVTADNLGVVYGYYLHEPLKAEKSFLKALELEPEAAYRYLRLFEFYNDVIKDSAKAKALLERGLKNIPNEPSLKSLLESLN